MKSFVYAQRLCSSHSMEEVILIYIRPPDFNASSIIIFSHRRSCGREELWIMQWIPGCRRNTERDAIAINDCLITSISLIEHCSECKTRACAICDGQCIEYETTSHYQSNVYPHWRQRYDIIIYYAYGPVCLVKLGRGLCPSVDDFRLS